VGLGGSFTNLFRQSFFAGPVARSLRLSCGFRIRLRHDRAAGIHAAARQLNEQAASIAPEAAVRALGLSADC